MKEKIYTIPVTEAFAADCECPVCILERKLEDEYVTYFMGPSLMEPDCRMDTNRKGFCRRHFEQMYNRQENRLGLGLMIDTHMTEQNEKIKQAYNARAAGIREDAGASLFKSLSGKFTSKATDTSRLTDELITLLTQLENSCAACSKLDFTMDRYMDVILYLWFNEIDFKKQFNSRQGFCLKHFRQLLEAVKKYLGPREAAQFVDNLLQMQQTHLERVQQEVNWFTKKFDYRYNEAPWGNSKDAIPRSIQKLKGTCDLK